MIFRKYDADQSGELSVTELGKVIVIVTLLGRCGYWKIDRAKLKAIIVARVGRCVLTDADVL